MAYRSRRGGRRRFARGRSRRKSFGRRGRVGRVRIGYRW